MNKQLIYHYLNIHGTINQNIELLIDQCIQEVQELAEFRVVSQYFHLQHQPLKIKELDLELSSQDLSFYFQECHECFIVACTLGIQIDRRIKYYEHIDMTKAIVFDAVSNAYLEECQNQYEKSLNLGNHTFRFAPGYGDIALTLNKTLAKVLQIDKKLGVSINDGGLFLPMKSMLGIIGLGKEVKKRCLSCLRKEQCELRKGGLRCYVID